MNNNGKRGSGEQNHTLFEKKSRTNGVVNGGLGSGSSTEDNTILNKVTAAGNNDLRGRIQIQESLQVSQPPQGPADTCWGRFLPVRSIKVLLVEDDDSTRHVVHALLRNCSYEGITIVLMFNRALELECMVILSCYICKYYQYDWHAKII